MIHELGWRLGMKAYCIAGFRFWPSVGGLLSGRFFGWLQ
jgi:hypothetical protein